MATPDPNAQVPDTLPADFDFNKGTPSSGVVTPAATPAVPPVAPAASVPDTLPANFDFNKPTQEKKEPEKGLLHKAWDAVNTPGLGADYFLPEGAKTADMVKAIAFEHLYHQAYVPGQNDFDTKAAIHFGDKPSKQYLRTLLNGIARDTSNTVASFTSPLAVGTMGLGALGKVPGAVGTVAKVAEPFVGAAFGAQGAYQTGQAAKDIKEHGTTPENLQAGLMGLSQMAMGTPGAIHGAETLPPALRDIHTAFHDALTPSTIKPKAIGGTEVPVRSQGTLAKMAEARQPETAKQFLVEKTAPAVARGLAETIQEAAKIPGVHPMTTEDPFGLSSMTEPLKQEYQGPVQHIDNVSDNAFSNAQMARDRVSGDFSKEGKAEWVKQKKVLEDLWEQYRPQLEADGIDVDKAKTAWGRKSALETIEKRLRTATALSADPERPFDLKTGKTLSTVIKNLLQHDDAPFQKLFGSEYTKTKPILEDFARTLDEQSKIAGQGQAPMDKFINTMGRRIVVDAIGGGIGTAVGGPAGGVAGAALTDVVTNKLANVAAKWYLGKILTTPRALDLVNTSLKLDANPEMVIPKIKAIVHNTDPSWTDRAAAYLSSEVIRLVRGERGEAGLPGTVREPGEEPKVVTENPDWHHRVRDVLDEKEQAGIPPAHPESHGQVSDTPHPEWAHPETGRGMVEDKLHPNNRGYGVGENRPQQQVKVDMNAVRRDGIPFKENTTVKAPEGTTPEKRYDFPEGLPEKYVHVVPEEGEAKESPFKILDQNAPRVTPDLQPREELNRATIQGGELAEPKSTYHEADKTDGNPWVRRSVDPANDAMPTNEKRTLLVQFSSDLLNQAGMTDEASAYFDKLYSGLRSGYARMHDFWEIPQWIGFASHFLPDADVYVVRNMEQAKQFLNQSKYGHVAFSALDINRSFIKELAKDYDGTFDVGGYVKPEDFADTKNIRWHNNMESFAKEHGVEYRNGVNYRHFTGSDVIPRLTLSDGCLHKCAFCTMPRTIKMTPDAVVMQQAEEIGRFGSKLVYLNDKTFGQAPNYKTLPEVYNRVKKLNPDFQGFIIQTTAAQMGKLTPEFLNKAGIKFVEIGVETYNDALLKELHKPASESLIDKAVDKLRQAKVALIPNIIIGFPNETAETYNHTLEFIRKNEDIISHSNIYNLALYKDAELGKQLTTASPADFNQNVLEKSFHTNPEIHKTFAGELYGLAGRLVGKVDNPLFPPDGNAVIANLHNENGGSSFHVTMGDISGKEGYAVGVYPEVEKVVDGTKITPEDVNAYRTQPKVAAILRADPEVMIGTWVDNGKTHFDLSIYEPNADRAMALGQMHGQKAIFDLKNSENIPVDHSGTPAVVANLSGGEKSKYTFSNDEGVSGGTGTKTINVYLKDGDGKSIGILKLEKGSSETAKVHSSDITPAEQGKGLGQALYIEAAKVAKEKGFKYIESDDAPSESARRVWEKLFKGNRNFSTTPDAGLYKLSVDDVIEKGKSAPTEEAVPVQKAAPVEAPKKSGEEAVVPKFLYHVTPASNVDSILKDGLLTKYYGRIHGGTDIHPPKPAVYLSRKPTSDNLHSDLFGKGPLVVVQIDSTRLNQTELWPDDFIYQMFSDEDILSTPQQVAKALGVSRRQGKAVLEKLENASDNELPSIMKPFWKWYLNSSKGGEVASTVDIPASAIVKISPYKTAEEAVPVQKSAPVEAPKPVTPVNDIPRPAPTRQWPTTDELIKKYGEAPADPAHIAFIAEDGRRIAQVGTEHDVMLGGRPIDALREQYINETGTIRMRASGVYGGRQFAMSLPETGITQAQLEQLKALEPQMRTGTQYFEVASKGGDYITFRPQTGQSLDLAIRKLVPIRGESPEVTTPEQRGAALSQYEVGTRKPTAVNSPKGNDPNLTGGFPLLNEADKISPARVTQAGEPVLGVKQKLVAAVNDYKDNGLTFTTEDLANPGQAIEKTVEHLKDNIKYLYNAMPEEIKGPSKEWYVSEHAATKKMATDNGYTHPQTAGVTACLSPQNDWNNNKGLAERLIKHVKDDSNHAWTPKMDETASRIRNGERAVEVNEGFKRMIDQIRGKKLSEITARDPETLLTKKALWFRVLDEAHNALDTPIMAPDGTVQGSQNITWIGLDPIANALSILEDGSMDNISERLGQGHKVRNFYNNIINPWSEKGHLTIDTHAVGAAWMKPMSGDDLEVMHNFGSGNRAFTPSPAKHAATGLKGSYPLYEEAYRRAAKELGLQPRELQSVTWEGIRSLMGDEKKTPQLKKAVARIWQDVELGNLTKAQARAKIIVEANGFSKPAWLPREQWKGNVEPEETSFDFGANEENPSVPAKEAGVAHNDIINLGGWISRDGDLYPLQRRGDDHGVAARQNNLAKLTRKEELSDERDSYSEISALERGHIRVTVDKNDLYFQLYDLSKASTLSEFLNDLGPTTKDISIGWGKNDEHLKTFKNSDEAKDWLEKYK